MDLTHLYESKALADCTLRVIIGPDTVGEEQSRSVKRPRVDTGNVAASDACVRVIEVNAGIIATHSRYLLSALSGACAESPNRVVDLRVPSEDAFADLELLIKLCYGPSYVTMDSKPVDRETLFRLLPLADSFAFQPFVDAVLDALRDELTLQEVHTAFQCIPHTLWEDERLKGFWEDAAQVMAERIPYLDEVVGAGQLCASLDGPLPLLGSVKELPPFFLEYLLPSEELNIQHENDVFSFVMTFLEQHMQAGTLSSAEGERFCDRVLPLLSYQHMTRHFIGRVVSNHPRMRERLGLIVGVTHRMSIADRGTASGDTMGTSEHIYSFSVSDDLLPLQPGGSVSRWAGLSFGYPVILTLTRSGDGRSVYIDVTLRFIEAHNDDERLPVVIKLDHTGLEGLQWLDVSEKSGVDGVSAVRVDRAFEGVPWAGLVDPGSWNNSEGKIKFVLNVKMKLR